MKRPDRFQILGTLVLVAVLFDISVNISKYGSVLDALWFCNVTAFILAAGLFRKDPRLLTMTLVLAVPGQFMWIADFFLEMFGHGLGRTAELWGYGPVVFFSSVTLHGLLIPCSFYGVWKKGFDPKALVPAMIYVYILLTVTFLLTPPAENVNCVFFRCDGEDPGAGYWRHFIIGSLLVWSVVVPVVFQALRWFFGRFSPAERTA